MEREPFSIGDMHFEGSFVDYSNRAPAAGYRITAGRVLISYVPDVVPIRDRSAALAGARRFIGDGSTLTRSLAWASTPLSRETACR